MKSLPRWWPALAQEAARGTSLLSRFHCGSVSFFLHCLVPLWIELTTQVLTEFGRPTRNFRLREAERKKVLHTLHFSVFPLFGASICDAPCMAFTQICGWLCILAAYANIPLHWEACWNQHFAASPHVKDEKDFDELISVQCYLTQRQCVCARDTLCGSPLFAVYVIVNFVLPMVEWVCRW